MSKEEELKKLEEEISALSTDETDLTGYSSPEPEKKESIYKFFREILTFKDAWKVGNLADQEIGKTALSVRSLLELSQYAEAEGLDLVSGYFRTRAELTSATTMGRKGFFPQIVVTNIKKEQKLSEPKPKKKKWFGKTEGEENEQQQ